MDFEKGFQIRYYQDEKLKKSAINHLLKAPPHAICYQNQLISPNRISPEQSSCLTFLAARESPTLFSLSPYPG